MDLRINIDKDVGIRALKLTVIAGELTDANDAATAGTEYIATCEEEASIVLFEADEGNIPAAGIPTGNYDICYSEDDSPTYTWNELVTNVSLFNNDAGTVLDAKVLQSDYNTKVGEIEGRLDSAEADVGSAEGRLDALETTVDTAETGLSAKVDDHETQLAGLLIDVSSDCVVEIDRLTGVNDFVLIESTFKKDGTADYAIGNFVAEYYFDNSSSADFAGTGETIYNQVSNSSHQLVLKPRPADDVWDVGDECYAHFRVKFRSMDGTETPESATMSINISKPVKEEEPT